MSVNIRKLYKRYLRNANFSNTLKLYRQKVPPSMHFLLSMLMGVDNIHFGSDTEVIQWLINSAPLTLCMLFTSKT